MQPVVKKSPALAVGGLILSGVLMVTGSLLTWYELEYSGLSLTVKGTDISMGNGVLRIGVLVTLIAVILLNRASKTGGRGWSIAAFILAVVVLPCGGCCTNQSVDAAHTSCCGYPGIYTQYVASMHAWCGFLQQALWGKETRLAL